MLLDGTGCRRIAYDLGFADESHYIAAFHKQYGCTPAQYRRVHTD
jgi:AraC-like DNA-binding protein